MCLVGPLLRDCEIFGYPSFQALERADAMQWAGLQRNTSAGADNLTCVQKPETYLMNCAILREI